MRGVQVVGSCEEFPVEKSKLTQERMEHSKNWRSRRLERRIRFPLHLGQFPLNRFSLEPVYGRPPWNETPFNWMYNHDVWMIHTVGHLRHRHRLHVCVSMPFFQRWDTPQQPHLLDKLLHIPILHSKRLIVVGSNSDVWIYSKIPLFVSRIRHWVICNNAGFEPCVARLPMKVDSVAWQTWLRMLVIDWSPLRSMIFLYKSRPLVEWLTITMHKNTSSISNGLVNELFSTDTEHKHDKRLTPLSRIYEIGPHAGKSRIKFCSSLSSTSNTI